MNFLDCPEKKRRNSRIMRKISCTGQNLFGKIIIFPKLVE